MLATLLLVFGAAAVASVPVSSAFERKEHARSADDVQRIAEVRHEARGIVSAVQRKGASGGKDILPNRSVADVGATRSVNAQGLEFSDGTRVAQRPFKARAPPVLKA
jgi:hypothetical protein